MGPMNQASLFDQLNANIATHSVAMSAASRDAAIARGASHTDEHWKSDARAALTHVARTQERFICDAVWLTGLRRPANDARALGGIMRWGVRTGLIVATDEYDKSAAVKSHRVPRVIWASLVFVA